MGKNKRMGMLTRNDKQQQTIIGVLKIILETPRALVGHENFLFGQ